MICRDNLYRELVVMTRPKKLLSYDPSPGHAMIAVSTEGGKVEAWGFYNTADKDGIYVRDEIEKGGWGRYTTSSVLNISPIQYQNIISEVQKWKSKKYILTHRDCTDFVLAILESANIPTPKDSLWPGNLGDDITEMHGSQGGRCVGAQVQGGRPATLPWK